MSKHVYYLILFFALFSAISCRVERFIPEGKKLYGGGDIKMIKKEKIKNTKGVEEELNALLKPKPNSKFLGRRVGLYYYYKAEKDSNNKIVKYLNKKIGEAPVYYDDISQKKTMDLIDNRLENKGFFKNEITTKVKDKKLSKKITYEVAVKKPFTLAVYTLDNDTLPIYEDLKKALNKSPLKVGKRYDLSVFKLERARIDAILKQNGYYNFNEDFLLFEVDTTQYKQKQFALYLRLKKDIPKKAIVPYRIDEVNVYPNYSIAQDSVFTNKETYKGVQFLQDSVFFKPKYLRNGILLKNGAFYDPKASRTTAKRLSSIGTYKYVNIQYDEVKKNEDYDSIGHLKANIYLSPLNKRALGFEVQAVTKSNNFAGPGLSMNYLNRNLFKSGESLSITGTIAYETQIGGDNKNLNGFQLGLKSSLNFPRLIFPGDFSRRFKYGLPQTKIITELEYLKRSELYSLASFNSNFGYVWDGNKYLTHKFNPLYVNYVRLSDTTPDFDAILEENPFLRSSFNQQFIAGLTYNLTYNELGRNNSKNQIYFSGTMDIAGNLLSLFSRANERGKKQILNLEFAQFAKVDADVRHYHHLSKNQTLVTRLYAGLGVPYGNSEVLPFTKQFFSGGSYSVRGFQSRSIGPGRYNGNGNSFFDRSGDIRLEANFEYRFPVYSLLKGALFTDAGNVWLYKENENLPGGAFSKQFLNDLAVSVGAGLRVDIQSFVVRFDLASPIKTPTSKSLKVASFKDAVLNFAIGYPF